MHREKVKVCPKCGRPFPVKFESQLSGNDAGEKDKKGECPRCRTPLRIPVRGDPVPLLVPIYAE